MAKTAIEWSDFSFNAWRGCSRVSEGCRNCFAEAIARRNPGTLGIWGPKGTRVVASETTWKEPIRWNKRATEAGVRHRVFCASLADIFEDWKGPMVDNDGAALHECAECGNWRSLERMCHGPNAHCALTMQDVRNRLFKLIDSTPNLDWLLLTKRPENVLWMAPLCWSTNPVPEKFAIAAGIKNFGFPLNVWIGTSVEDQATADSRIPHLLKVPAKVRFLSMEPLLGPVDLHKVGPLVWDVLHGWKPAHGNYPEGCNTDRIDWVIVGGESGPDARPMRMEWAKSIIDRCKAADVPVFMKQLGSSPTTTLPDGESWPGHSGPSSDVQFSGDGFGNYLISGLKDKKGGNPTEWPMAFRVRQFPEGRHA